MVHIEEERMWEGMVKHHVKGLPFDAVFHTFTKPDHGDPHDHPWGFWSVVLAGSYVEEVFDVMRGTSKLRTRSIHESFYVPANHIHRVVNLPQGECVTLIRPQLHHGEQKSGFYKFDDDAIRHRYWDETEWRRIS